MKNPILDKLIESGRRQEAEAQAAMAAKVEERAQQLANERDLGTVIWRATLALFIVVALVSLAWKLLRWCWS